MAAIDNFSLNPADLSFLGEGLSRPECILAERDGTLRIADNRGIYTLHRPGKPAELIGERRGTPNGMALDRDGSLVVADIDAENVYRVGPSGAIETLLDRLDGQPLGAVNFVYFDSQGRLWITVSTRVKPRGQAVEGQIPDGYILLADASGVRVVADGICFTNEVRIDAAGEFLYAAETAAGHVSRFRIGDDGSLRDRSVFGPSPLFPGAKIDGITFDADGNLWVTEITRNALVVIRPDGSTRTVFADPAGDSIVFPTSVTFGGDDLKTVFIGSLKMSRIAWFRSPVAGAPMYHW